jgi:hypothetical protein
MLCLDFVWLPVFAHGWTEAVRLHDLGSAIAALTATDALHVKRHDVLDFCRYWRMRGQHGWWQFYMGLRLRISPRERT